MENDHLKSDDQMEIIMMMQQMADKIPEFYTTAYNDLSPQSDFSSSSNNISTTDPHCVETFQHGAESSMNPPLLPPTGPPRWRCGETDTQKQRRSSSSVAAMREMIFRMAVMQPIHIDPESVKAPKRRNVKISTDPQSVAARHRRERISERIRILQRLVPGGTKMDTASMLDEAIHYVKFLKTQVQSLERAASNSPLMITTTNGSLGFPLEISSGSCYNVPAMPKPSSMPHNLEQFGDA